MEIRNGNGKLDPMLAASLPSGVELFDAVSKCCNGFPAEAVINAGANLVINALRQGYAKREAAETAFDEIFGRMKQALVDHYDMLGRKRGIFPYDQIIQVPLLDPDDKQWRG